MMKIYVIISNNTAVAAFRNYDDAVKALKEEITDAGLRGVLAPTFSVYIKELVLE